MDLGLNNANAIITGGTKGIGRAIAETLAREGCNVGICARNGEEVRAAVDALSAQGVRAIGDAVDVGDADAYRTFLKSAAQRLGGCDVFVSNVSGGNAPGEAGWRANFEFDVMGAVRGVEALMPALEASPNGNVVFISTTAALEHFIGASAYGAMKAALINYGSNLAVDLAPKGIRVNTVSPGPIFVEGGAWDFIRENMKPLYDSTLAQIPSGRLGRAEEVAHAVAMIASPRGGFITGTNIVVDGGFTKRVQF